MQIQMTQLFDIYYQQCPSERIFYTAQNERQSWIVMNGIELSYMMYQDSFQPIFMCTRYCEKFGDDVYYFKTFKECQKVFLMDEHELTEYVESITIL